MYLVCLQVFLLPGPAPSGNGDPGEQNSLYLSHQVDGGLSLSRCVNEPHGAIYAPLLILWYNKGHVSISGARCLVYLSGWQYLSEIWCYSLWGLFS